MENAIATLTSAQEAYLAAEATKKDGVVALVQEINKAIKLLSDCGVAVTAGVCKGNRFNKVIYDPMYNCVETIWD